MRWLFVVSTPFQLYYAASIIFEHLDRSDNAEVLLTPQFPNALMLTKRFQTKGIFKKIHICPCGFNRTSFVKIQLLAYFGKYSFCPKSLLNEYFDYYALSMPACPNSSVYFALRKTNRKLKVVFFEDGTGTYTGEIFRNATYLGPIPSGVQKPSKRARIYRAIFGLLPKKLNSYEPTKLIVRQPAAISYSASIPIVQVQINNKHLGAMYSCFGEPTCLPATTKAIILDPPRTSNEAIQELDFLDLIIKKATNKSRIALKEHPRTTCPSIYRDECFIISDNQWELFCKANTMNEKILIGVGSSAQLTPILENGEKPILIFLYKLFIKTDSQLYRSYTKIVQIAKCLYKNNAENLIFTPSNESEALDCIFSLLESS